MYVQTIKIADISQIIYDGSMELLIIDIPDLKLRISEARAKEDYEHVHVLSKIMKYYEDLVNEFYQ